MVLSNFIMGIGDIFCEFPLQNVDISFRIKVCVEICQKRKKKGGVPIG